MYAGHFVAGLVLKTRVPRAPTWGLMVGVGVLDILFGPFVLLGWERVSIMMGSASRGRRRRVLDGAPRASRHRAGA